MTTAAQALVEIEPQRREVAPISPEASIFSVIERAARDQNVDIDKMERLIAMRERELGRVAEQAFNESMKAAQEEMRPISADANNPQTKSKYASYAKLDSALRPIYTKHGFAVSFDEGDTPKPDHIRCLAYVTHDAGHTRTYRKDMPADGKGAKGGDVMTKTHATGAAAQYGMRYLLKGIFNVAVGEGDTDGNAPTDERVINKEQAATLLKLIEETGTPIEKFCEWAKIEAVPELLACHFDKAVQVLNMRRTAA
jgi:hypothetical protein